MATQRSNKRGASEDWETSAATRIRYDDGQSHSCAERSVSMASEAAAEAQTLDDQISALATSFQRLRIGSAFEQLPDEVINSIFQYLVPDAIPLGPGTSLLARDHSAKCRSFFASRADVINVGMVNKRFNKIASPLRYRSVLISQPWTLCRVLVSLIQNPSLGSLVRHLSVALPFGTPQISSDIRRNWEALSQICLSGFDFDPCLPRLHPYRKLLTWFAGLSHHTSKFPPAVFCTVLCFTNRLETLNFRSDPPTSDPYENRTSLWNWFLDDDNPFAESDVPIPKEVITGTPFREQLASSPMWPPPYLRDVSVECDLGLSAGTVIKLDLVPHAEAVDHRHAFENSGLDTDKKPLEHLNRDRICKMSASELVSLRSYLDGIMRIPELEYADDDVHEYVDVLKSLTYKPVPDPLDMTAARKLEATLKLLPLDWSPRLSVRSKRIALSLNDFLRNGQNPRTIEQTMTMRNVDTLTLRAETVAFGCGSVDRPAAFAVGRLSLHNRLLGEHTPFVRYLERLHLLLRMEDKVTTSIYARGGGRIAKLHRLRSLKELSITTEGLFGPWQSLGSLFGGPKFVSPANAPIYHGSVFGIPYPLGPPVVPVDDEDSDSEDNKKLRAIVEDLPPNLETLRLVDWYGQYADPIRLPIITSADNPKRENQHWVKKLAGFQKGILLGLTKLAPVLKEKRPSVKSVTFWVHRWDDKEADAVWVDWSKGKDGLKKLKKVYKEAGITLRVVTLKERTTVGRAVFS